MPIPAWLKKRFGDNIPSYIVNFYKRRDARNEEAKRKEEEKKRKLEEERARIKALRRPPTKVYRIGQTLFWSPPETIDQLKPAGYWVSEGDSAHGDYVPIDVFESQLFGTQPARVEAYYNDTALGEAYISETVECVYTEDRFLVGKVKYYVREKKKQGAKAGERRWRRVLLAFGVGQKYYDLRRGVIYNDIEAVDLPMTASEARTYANRGWKRWEAVADVLERLERENG